MGKGLLDKQIGTQVLGTKREVSQHALKGLSFSLLRRMTGSVRFLESLLFLMCSHQVLIDSQHVPQVPKVFLNMFTSMMPITKGKRKRNLGAPHNKLICHTIKLHRTCLNSPDFL
jgi:hypothetical protein